MEQDIGFEPMTFSLERVARIELANKPWQGFRLPLHHTRIYYLSERPLAFRPLPLLPPP